MLRLNSNLNQFCTGMTIEIEYQLYQVLPLQSDIINDLGTHMPGKLILAVLVSTFVQFL